ASTALPPAARMSWPTFVAASDSDTTIDVLPIAVTAGSTAVFVASVRNFGSCLRAAIAESGAAIVGASGATAASLAVVTGVGGGDDDLPEHAIARATRTATGFTPTLEHDKNVLFRRGRPKPRSVLPATPAGVLWSDLDGLSADRALASGL